MPFKWRLKKTRKYDISSKNSFIVGVYLLDQTYLECTLSADSTGQECLNSIAQRISLDESSFFGLRYLTKKLHFNWVDLEKPLKKQLDKYAQQSNSPHNIYFGVMFYVVGAHKIPDEVARYHYYLQQKNDVIEGRLPCTVDQAIRLAAYSLQAEFGDYEPEKYVAEDYLLFPRTMMDDEGVAAKLLQEAINRHMSLQGVSPLQAELQYLKEVQMMDGYGAEYYNAKDESRKDMYLGTSFAGIFARYLDGQSTVYYRWAEIAKVTQTKKTIEIDTSKSSVQFQLEDTETAKYVSRLSQLQRTFYKSNKSNFRDAQHVTLPQPDGLAVGGEDYIQTLSSAQEQRMSQDYPEYIQSSQQSLSSSSDTQSQRSQGRSQGPPSSESGSLLHQQHVLRQDNVTPTPDSDPVYANRAALLPAYRPTPDYETVMRQRMLQQQQHQESQIQAQPYQHYFNELTPHLGAAQVYVHPDGMAYSQPEISRNMASYKDEHGNYANIDALRTYSHSIYSHGFQEGVLNPYNNRPTDRGANLVHPTYSSPELNNPNQNNVEFPQDSLTYNYRVPPPPYPRTSSSTPDLAQGIVNAGNTPDLLPQAVPQSQNFVDHSLEDLRKFQSQVPAFNINENNSKNYNFEGLENNTEISNYANVPDTPSHNKVSDETFGLVSNNIPDVAITGPPESNSSSPGDLQNRTLTEDQDDTSSEHSYSTFHAKDSEESSDDEAVRSRSFHKENKIQIRVVSAHEAPPPSKFKEAAVLRESFRRMKIARVGSLNKNVPVRQQSLKGLREVVETEPSKDSLLTTTIHTAVQLPNTQNTEVNTQISEHTFHNETSHSEDMKKVLDNLGAPPPYPGITSIQFDTQRQNVDISSTMLEEVSYSLPNEPSNQTIPSQYSHIQNSQITVKRSSSDTASTINNPPLPRRQVPDVKPRASTINLDTVVPISRTNALFHKDLSDPSTSVLKSDDSSSFKSDSSKSSTLEKQKVGVDSEGHEVNSRRESDGSYGSESLKRFHKYTLESSDSDSDTEQCASDPLQMGPLKMASLNGLTLSRSLVLSLMNDESRAPKDDRRRMLESKISEGQVYAEFEKIPKKASDLDCSVAISPANSARNRFKDVLPYDLTRVKLSSSSVNPEGYINASHIKLTANDNKWVFIATQAPLEKTAGDFWQMVWEQQVDVIAMLTPLQEMGKSKCFAYWPQETGVKNKQVYGDYEVELQLTDDSLCYLTSRILVVHKPTSREHQVWHLQYTDWPDHGCPEDTHGFLGFLDEVESVSRLAEAEHSRTPKSPVVVHCSAGVGRTGVVILTMVMKWCLEHNHNVDLPKALQGIRSQRMHMVQTMGQYKFIHDTLIQYLKNTRLI